MPFRPRTDRPGTWIIDVRVAGVRWRRTVRAKDARDAARLERELWREAEAAAAAGEDRRRRGPRLGELCARYWQEHGQHLSWHPHVRSHLNTWCDALGDDTLARTITAGHIAAIIGAWRGTFAPSTINRRLAVLRAVWYRARDVWSFTLPPIAWRRLTLREPESKDRSLTRAERQAFLDALPDRTRLPMLLIAMTGLRRSAVLRLTRGDLDWQRGIIRAVSKGQKETLVPITRAVNAVFTAIGRLPDCGLLFTVKPHQWRADVAAARAATGVAHAGAHPLRHSFAQDLEDAGYGDLITDALHHSSPTLRRRYAKARLSRTASILDQVQS